MRGFFRFVLLDERGLHEMGALGSHENDSLSEEPIIAKMYGGKHLSARQGAPEWVRGG